MDRVVALPRTKSWRQQRSHSTKIHMPLFWSSNWTASDEEVGQREGDILDWELKMTGVNLNELAGAERLLGPPAPRTPVVSGRQVLREPIEGVAG